LVRLDPRTTISDADLKLQTDLSLQCYANYTLLQDIRDVIDSKMNNPKTKWKKGQQEDFKSFRGNGEPDGGDILYSSISETSLDKESVVSLQDKFLYMITVLQSTEARPTEQAVDAVNKLSTRYKELSARWNVIK